MTPTNQDWYVRARLAKAIAVALVVAMLGSARLAAAPLQVAAAKPFPEEQVMPDLIRACAPYIGGALQFVRRSSTVSQFGKPTRPVNEEEARASIMRDIREVAFVFSRDQLAGDVVYFREELRRRGRAWPSYGMGATAFSACLNKRRIDQMDGKVVIGLRGRN
ncbi:MAG: hypothetical protein ABL995_11350 [Bryobacteraceae bacterium]